MEKQKFEYGAILNIHPTMGLDVEKGEAIIQGIVGYGILQEQESGIWLTGDAEEDWDIITSPWYYLQMVDEDIDPISYTFILPEFALEEVVHKANREKEKARKKIEFNKKIEIIRSIVLG